jgi:gluconate kinase
VGARVWVIGSSGAGKTTFGKRAAERLGCAFVELDAIVHQAGWRRLPDDEIRARDSRFAVFHLAVSGQSSAVGPEACGRSRSVCLALDPLTRRDCRLTADH